MNFEKLNAFYGSTLASNVQFLRSLGWKWKSAFGIEKKKEKKMIKAEDKQP